MESLENYRRIAIAYLQAIKNNKVEKIIKHRQQLINDTLVDGVFKIACNPVSISRNFRNHGYNFAFTIIMSRFYHCKERVENVRSI